MDHLESDQKVRTVDADVAVVGYGPVGMVVAALLGRRGHRVVVLERYPGLYNLPRAGVFDDETMRTFATLGITERILPKLKAPQGYWFQNDAGALMDPRTTYYPQIAENIRRSFRMFEDKDLHADDDHEGQATQP